MSRDFSAVMFTKDKFGRVVVRSQIRGMGAFGEPVETGEYVEEFLRKNGFLPPEGLVDILLHGAELKIYGHTLAEIKEALDYYETSTDPNWNSFREGYLAAMKVIHNLAEQSLTEGTTS